VKQASVALLFKNSMLEKGFTAMTDYEKKIAEKAEQIFGEEEKQDDWANCLQRIQKLLSFELRKSFQNGVRWANKPQQKR